MGAAAVVAAVVAAGVAAATVPGTPHAGRLPLWRAVRSNKRRAQRGGACCGRQHGAHNHLFDGEENRARPLESDRALPISLSLSLYSSLSRMAWPPPPARAYPSCTGALSPPGPDSDATCGPPSPFSSVCGAPAIGSYGKHAAIVRPSVQRRHEQRARQRGTGTQCARRATGNGYGWR